MLFRAGDMPVGRPLHAASYDLRTRPSHSIDKVVPMFLPLIFALAAMAAGLDGGDRADAIHDRISDPKGGLIVVAHRGCHAAAPAHALPSAPENSLAALEHCVAMGVDVMETDVRRAGDGTLVMIHDATLDRTTDGTGPVAAFTLPQLRALRLRQDLGGPRAAFTDARMLTLDEMLAAAKNRIVLNLDIKDAIYVEVIDAVVRAKAQDRVIVKAVASIATKPLAGMAPYKRVPFMPVLRFTRNEGQLLDVMRTQLSGSHQPLGFELPRLTTAIVPELVEVARKNEVRLWINTLDAGYVAGLGGDQIAATDPDRVWGAIERLGVSMIQTDNPEALLAFKASRTPANDK
jgi:glycerophosphoryl diester phosphodiesterase